MTSMRSFWCLYCQFGTYFTPFSSDFIADFEQANVFWVRTLLNIYDGAFNKNS